MLGARGCSGTSDKNVQNLYPESEFQFISATNSAHQQASAANDLQKEGIKKQRDTDICAVLSNKQNITKWYGSVSGISSTSKGAAIEIKLPNGVVLETWNNVLSDIVDNTIADKNSVIYKDIYNLSVGDTVIFSGSFVKNGKQCAEETSITTDGSLNSPEFLFKFSSISKR
jgi:hypothetical protein